MRKERALSAALSALAAECTEAPSPELERILREAFRTQAAKKSVLRKKLRLVTGLVTAAAAALLIAVSWISRQAAKPVIGSQPIVTAQQHSGAAMPDRVIAPASTAAEADSRTLHNPRAHTAFSQTAETATDFIRLPYTDPLLPTEQVNIFRVQMPEAALATYGLPVDGSRLDAKIDADLVVGQDGVPRAIRFIR